MTLSDIELEFWHLNAYHSNLLILRPDDALALIRRARAANVRVLGIDGFRLVGDGIQPDMGESVDFHTERNPTIDTWTAAEAFVIERQHGELVFEIVLDGPATAHGV